MINPLCKIDYSKYPLSKEDWKYFSTLNKSGRRKFLKSYNLQYMRGEVPRCSVCNHVFFNGKCGDKDYLKKMSKRKKKLNESFEEKLLRSQQLVKNVLDNAKQNNLIFYLAYSGGIDSECCLQLFKDGIKEGIIKVIVGNTTTELPDTCKRWKEAEKELDVKFLYSLPDKGVSFKSNAIKNGLPLFPRNYGDTLLQKPTKECCKNLKEYPQFKLFKSLKINGIILGLKATEQSYGRRLTIYKNGDYFLAKDGKWHIYPIAYWNIKDEWLFQKKMKFKYNKIYDKTNIEKKGFYKLKNNKLYQIRSGCGFCPQSIHKGYLEWLREYYPKWFKTLKKIYNEVALSRKPEKVGNIYYPNGINFLQVFILKNKMKLKETPCGEPI